MPYKIRKQKCKQSDGDAGNHVLSYTTKKGKKIRNCHTSKKKARGQIAAIEGPPLNAVDQVEGEELDENREWLMGSPIYLLREWVRHVLIQEDSRTSAGDAAQKRIAAYLVDQGLEASVNKSGSQTADVQGNVPGGQAASIESKNSEGGSVIYSQELTLGSKISDAIQFAPGTLSGGISMERFRPAKNRIPLQGKEAIASHEELNAKLKSALSNDTEEWQIIGGGTGPGGDESVGMNKSQWIRHPSVSWDGTILQKDDRPVVIIVAPSIVTRKGQKMSPKWAPTPDSMSRVAFLSDGSSTMRPAQGGKGQQSLGSFIDPGEKILTQAWRDYYKKGGDDYFAIVTGNSMYIGNIHGTDPLGIAPNQLTVRLASKGDKTSSYGGAKVTGLREKVMIEVLGGITVNLPNDAIASDYLDSGKITQR